METVGGAGKGTKSKLLMTIGNGAHSRKMQGKRRERSRCMKDSKKK